MSPKWITQQKSMSIVKLVQLVVLLIIIFTDTAYSEDQVEEEKVLDPPESSNATNSTDFGKSEKKKRDPL